MESLGRHIRFADNGELVPQSLPVRQMKGNMNSLFHDFDSSVLDDSAFKEDSVREEIVAPIIKRLKYSPSGSTRVERSKTLAHPFVMIGSKRHGVSIIPDYTLFVENVPLCVIDAKAPWEPVITSTHVEQAYSYAIHPEIRAHTYGLHNGRELALYSISGREPILRVPLVETDMRWDEVEKFLSPKSLAEPFLREFDPDFGLHYTKIVGQSQNRIHGDCYKIKDLAFVTISKVDDSCFTGAARVVHGGREFLASFDFPPHLLWQIAPGLDDLTRPAFLGAFSSAPWSLALDVEVRFDAVAILGQPVKGQHNEFVPFNVIRFQNVRMIGTALDPPPAGGPPMRLLSDLIRSNST